MRPKTISEREIPANLRPHFAVVSRLIEEADRAKLKGRVFVARRVPSGVEVQELERDELPPDLIAMLEPNVDTHMVLLGERGEVMTVAVHHHDLSPGGDA